MAAAKLPQDAIAVQVWITSNFTYCASPITSALKINNERFGPMAFSFRNAARAPRVVVALFTALLVLTGPASAMTEPPFRPAFEAAGERHGLDWRLLAAIARKESRFDPEAVGPSGARGVMQVLPETALGMGVSIWNLTDPAQGIEVGARYIRRLLDVWLDEPDLDDETRLQFAVAAYHVGPGRLRRLRNEAAERGLDRNRWRGHVERMVAEDVAPGSAAYVSEVFATRARYGEL